MSLSALSIVFDGGEDSRLLREKLGLNQSDQSPWYADHRSDYFVNKDGLIYAGAHLIIDMWDAINLSNREIIQNHF